MTLSYDDAGSGPALVLLHSSVCDRRMWDPRPFLAAGFRVLRIDLPGFGDSPALPAGYNEAEEVSALLDALGIGAVALVGSSYGGRISQEIAARWPGRVTGLVLLCAGRAGHTASPELREFYEREAEFLAAGDLDGAIGLNLSTWLGPAASAETRAEVRGMKRRGFEVEAAFGAYAPRAMPVDVTAIVARTLVVTGALDLGDFREIAEVLGGAIPGARAVELPWAGHLPILERPAETAALVLGFLGAV